MEEKKFIYVRTYIRCFCSIRSGADNVPKNVRLSFDKVQRVYWADRTVWPGVGPPPCAREGIWSKVFKFEKEEEDKQTVTWKYSLLYMDIVATEETGENFWLQQIPMTGRRLSKIATMEIFPKGSCGWKWYGMRSSQTWTCILPHFFRDFLLVRKPNYYFQIVPAKREEARENSNVLDFLTNLRRKKKRTEIKKKTWKKRRRRRGKTKWRWLRDIFFGVFSVSRLNQAPPPNAFRSFPTSRTVPRQPKSSGVGQLQRNNGPGRISSVVLIVVYRGRFHVSFPRP